MTWYDSGDAWSFARGTVGGTVHLHFPRWTRPFASNIMAHVAHHIDPRVQLVRLVAPEAGRVRLAMSGSCWNQDGKEVLRFHAQGVVLDEGA
ncbi:hypothetical protein ACMHYB_24330 [Sorangium sp. So ce1128]